MCSTDEYTRVLRLYISRLPTPPIPIGALVLFFGLGGLLGRATPHMAVDVSKRMTAFFASCALLVQQSPELANCDPLHGEHAVL